MLMQYLDADERGNYEQGSFVGYTKEQTKYRDVGDDWGGVVRCAYCGDEMPNAYGRRYCSQRCANDAYMARRRDRQKEQRSKVCPVCGKHFEAERKSAVYCSRACKQKAYRRRSAQLP